MKKNLTYLIAGLGIAGTALAQTSLTGPSTSQTPYMISPVPGSTVISILTASESVGGYLLCGLGDGMGAFDDGGTTFTLLINHEMGTSSGVARAHGSAGAFVSKWVINKSNLSVVSGSDLIQDVKLWTGSTYTTYNSANPSTLTTFGRFCAADLPEVSAFYNRHTGLGTKNRMFMNGEENGNEGRGFAHIATGPEAGTSYQLPYLGKFSWENSVASPFAADKTIVVGTDDSSPGQVYVYIGNKSNSGSDIVKAGLTGGKLYGIGVIGLVNESSGSLPAPNKPFALVDLGAVHNVSGSTLNTTSNNLGVTNFLRPEDGAWDPETPTDFYFVTTNSFTTPSRLWRLRFYDISNPELGGTITAVLDGTEGHKMLDNMVMDGYGNIFLQEDPGNQSWTAKVWQYNIKTDVLTLIIDQDPTRFVSGGANYLTQDEESSGIIDMQSMLGPGWFLLYDQAHYSIPGEVDQGGQLMAFYNPATAAANPEINVQGNSANIISGDLTPSAGDNTSFGTVNTGKLITKTFVVQNAGPGVLTVKSLSMGGINAGDFSVLGSAPINKTLAVNGSLNVMIQFSPGNTGLRSGMLHIFSNDATESEYIFAIEGSGAAPEINLQGNSNNIPAGSTTPDAQNNTSFGSILYNTTQTNPFTIQNTGNGTLTINNITISGADVSAFTLVNSPATPFTINGGASKALSIGYSPKTVGTHTAMVAIGSDDSDEGSYNFVISGEGLLDVGIEKATAAGTFASLYPNPANDDVTVQVQLKNAGTVTINVSDIAGKQVMKSVEKELNAGNSKIVLNTSSLKSGTYMVSVSHAGKTDKINLVITH